jgi:hypothetical protein
LWLDTEHPVLGCTACQLDRRVYGIEIEFARTRRRPIVAAENLKMVAGKPPFNLEKLAHGIAARQSPITNPAQPGSMNGTHAPESTGRPRLASDP